MWHFARIETKDDPIHIVTENPKKEWEILSSHKTKKEAVEKMARYCGDWNYMQIENTKFYHQELVDLLEKWDQ